MKEDRDLSFLAYCKNEDLKTLVDMLTHDTNGEVAYQSNLQIRMLTSTVIRTD